MRFPQKDASYNYLPRVIVLATPPCKSEIIEQGLLNDGFDVTFASREEEARALVTDQRPDLLLAEAPVLGTELEAAIVGLRAASRTQYLPIAIWGNHDQFRTATAVSNGHIDGFVSGQLKPSSGAAVLRAVLRRVRPAALTGRLEYSLLVIKELERRVEWDGTPLHMSPTEYRFLAALTDEPAHFLIRSELLRRVWGLNVSNPSNSINQTSKTIRALLRPVQADHVLETVHRVGLRLS